MRIKHNDVFSRVDLNQRFAGFYLLIWNTSGLAAGPKHQT
jgi:hypothetical protein